MKLKLLPKPAAAGIIPVAALPFIPFPVFDRIREVLTEPILMVESAELNLVISSLVFFYIPKANT